MDITLFKHKLLFCKTKEEKRALYEQYPDLAAQHEEQQKEVRSKRPYNLPPLPELPPPTQIDIEGTLPLGSIIEKHGRRYKVTNHFTITSQQSAFLADAQDMLIDPGTYSVAELI